jgi:hypothetical protein
MKQDWDYNGNNLGPRIPVRSVDECWTRCHQNINCKAFMYYDRWFGKDDCYLKSSIGGGGQHKYGHISGQRLGKRDTKDPDDA